jgi:hypothetical protein
MSYPVIKIETIYDSLHDRFRVDAQAKFTDIGARAFVDMNAEFVEARGHKIAGMVAKRNLAEKIASKVHCTPEQTEDLISQMQKQTVTFDYAVKEKPKPKVIQGTLSGQIHWVGGVVTAGDITASNITAQSNNVKGESISRAASKLPGVGSRFEFPCGCRTNRKVTSVDGAGLLQMEYEDAGVRVSSLYNIIMHLNDLTDSVHAEWTREKIADWLDELHDAGKVNIEFQGWDEPELPPDPEVTQIDLDGWQPLGYTTDEDKFPFNTKHVMELKLTDIDEETLKLLIGDTGHYSIGKPQGDNNVQHED